MKHSFEGDLFEREKKLYLIWCWLIFHLIDKGFYPSHEFVFCNKLDRIRIQNFGAKVAYRANIPRSNIEHLTHIGMFTDPSFIQLSKTKIYIS